MLERTEKNEQNSPGDSAGLSYDRLAKYLIWMSSKGLVHFDSNDDVLLTEKGINTYDEVVKWILQYVGKVRFPKIL